MFPCAKIHSYELSLWNFPSDGLKHVRFKFVKNISSMWYRNNIYLEWARFTKVRVLIKWDIYYHFFFKENKNRRAHACSSIFYFAMLCKITGTMIPVNKEIGATLRTFLFTVEYKENWFLWFSENAGNGLFTWRHKITCNDGCWKTSFCISVSEITSFKSDKSIFWYDVF